MEGTMNHDAAAYGLWTLVIINSLVFILFCIQLHTSQNRPRLAFLRCLFIFIFGGFILLSASWRVLYKALQAHKLATTGPYAHVRHPQYGGFILIMLGFLLEWPTLPTLVMFPVLVTMYVRLAHREEREVMAKFGSVYEQYAQNTPAF